MTFIIVLLPEPFGPMRPCTLFLATLRSTRLSAFRPPNCITKPFTSSTGWSPFSARAGLANASATSSRATSVCSCTHPGRTLRTIPFKNPMMPSGR